MNKTRTITISTKYWLIYIVFTVLLYSIFYYTNSFSYTESVKSLKLIVIAWPCCVLIGAFLYLTQILKQRNTIANFGMFLCIYMLFLVFLIGERSINEIFTDSVYSMLWISLFCIFMFYSAKYGMPNGISTETFLFLPIITFVFIQSVLLNQTDVSVKTLNPIYYILYLVPFVLLAKKPLYCYVGLSLIFISVILSNKRTALIALAFVVVYYFFVKNNDEQKTTSASIKKFLLSILFVAAIILIYNYTVEHFKIDWWQRLSTLGETGGAGRTQRWRQFFIDMGHSSPLEYIFGHGIVYPYYHNDWMQIYYNTGLIGFLLYTTICVKLVRMYFEMKKVKYRYVIAYGASLIIFFFNSFVGQVIVIPYWFLEMSVFWGLIFGDYYYIKHREVSVSDEIT